MIRHFASIAFALSAVVILTAGCSDSTTSVSSSTYADVRAAVWSDAPLAGDTVTPTDIKDSKTPGPQTVMLAGRIDAGDMDAFDQSEATFILSQLPDESHGAGDPDHADNCPFCKRKLKNAPKAIVRITDYQDQPIPVAASELLGLEKDDVVVVEGEAFYDQTLNTVMIRASKIAKK